MKQELKQNIESTFNKLESIVSSFKDEEVNVIPFEGSWTPGQVVEHMIKSVSNLPAFFSNTAPTLRDPAEKINEIKKIFLDFTIKMQSPDFIVPTRRDHNKEALLAKLAELKEQMISVVETQDLSLTCKGFEFPGWGYLTRLEWIHFFIAHTQRHTHQLENIHQTLNRRLWHLKYL